MAFLLYIPHRCTDAFKSNKNRAVFSLIVCQIQKNMALEESNDKLLLVNNYARFFSLNIFSSAVSILTLGKRLTTIRERSVRETIEGDAFHTIRS